jgi:hypothetical protein
MTRTPAGASDLNPSGGLEPAAQRESGGFARGRRPRAEKIGRSGFGFEIQAVDGWPGRSDGWAPLETGGSRAVRRGALGSVSSHLKRGRGKDGRAEGKGRRFPLGRTEEHPRGRKPQESKGLHGGVKNPYRAAGRL